MVFNLDQGKQAQEVIFSRNTNRIFHPPLTLSMQLKLMHTQKHLGLQLGSKMNCHSTNILTIKSVRQQKLLVLFVNWNLFYHAGAYYL